VTPAELDAIEARAEAARLRGEHRVRLGEQEGGPPLYALYLTAKEDEADALVRLAAVLTPAAALALVAEVRAGRAEIGRLRAALVAADALADAAWQDIHDDEAAPLHAQMATRVTLADYDKARGRGERR
jgi:hypothetical protein